MTNNQDVLHPKPTRRKQIATVELPPHDDVIIPNGDHHGDDGNDLERELGLR